MLLEGTLPLDACVLDLLESGEEEGVVGSGVVEVANDLVAPGGLERALQLRRRILEQVRRSADVRTVGVPFGASVLERYTQADVVTAWIPDVDQLQVFASLTWYLFNADEGSTGKIEPGALSEDGIALQFGYPVGDPLEGDVGEFDADLMAGLIFRVNQQISFSGGIVFGDRITEGSEESERLFFVSSNLDVTSLEPFKMIFARKD